MAAEALRHFVSDCYQALGVPEASATLLADTLVQSDLWGHPSHGVMRVFWYAQRLRSGAIDLNASPKVDGGLGALVRMDGQNGFGQVVAHSAMSHAIAVAQEYGIGCVSVRNSGHFGTAMYFTKMAAAAGCVGFLSTNASPSMAPWGGVEKRVGTNPWSWAAPAGRYAPMMLDIANTAVARGKLYVAKSRGESIPKGWAIDASGNATCDPEAGIAGTILPMGGHKGYAIATVMDMLSGILTGSRFGASITGPYEPEGKSGVGHLVIAINVAACRPLSEFEADMERLIDELKSTPRQSDVEEIFYPGELEALRERKARRSGIDLPRDTAAELLRNAADLGIEAPFEL
ncbi:MAG: Ldh family oxidoreductase [Pseudomonadota bacterium]